MKQAVNGSNKQGCSDKLCCCGGHSSHDVKKNKHHNSTKMKILIRKSRKAATHLTQSY